MLKKNLFLTTSVSLLLSLVGCETVLLQSQPYETAATNARAWARLQGTDIELAQVRVVRQMDMNCAGRRIPIPGGKNLSESANEDMANFWRNAALSDMSQAGKLNEKNPKVRIYNLIDKVSFRGEPTNLTWFMEMELFSSNGSRLKVDVEYNVPTDSLQGMNDACQRLADHLDNAVAWSILKTVSSPAFAPLVQPGLDYVPSMKAESITGIIDPSEKDDVWKVNPKGKTPETEREKRERDQR